MAEEVVKTVENVDKLFAEIVVNGETFKSENYVAPVTTKKTVVKSSSATSTPTSSESSSTRQTTGDDVYAVLLNDVLHNFVDRAVTESLAEEVQERERVDGILGEHVTDLQSDVTNLGTDVGNIEALIPSQATAENQLADKDFVNSSIATNTANFLGTYTSLADITAIPNPTNNDYAFLQTVDTAGNTIYQRYKYSAQTSSWLFEYELNNSGFTAEQWATINSGLTQNLVDTAITNAINALDVSSKGGSGKYIESISQVDGAIVPVEATIADEVTSGNMQSVTSNAVAEALSYSETEHQVGTWIDGSPLYERTIVERVSANGSYSFSIPTNHKVKFWTGNFFQDSITNPNWIMKIPYTFIDANNNTKYLVMYCYVDPNNHSFNFSAYGTYESSYYNGYAVITYKYTKG